MTYISKCNWDCPKLAEKCSQMATYIMKGLGFERFKRGSQLFTGGSLSVTVIQRFVNVGHCWSRLPSHGTRWYVIFKLFKLSNYKLKENLHLLKSYYMF